MNEMTSKPLKVYSPKESIDSNSLNHVIACQSKFRKIERGVCDVSNKEKKDGNDGNIDS